MNLAELSTRAAPDRAPTNSQGSYSRLVSGRLETQVPLGFSLWLDNSKPRHVRGFSFTVCVSAGTELGGECGVGQETAPAVHHRHRTTPLRSPLFRSGFQLALEFVEEAPIRVLGNELLRAGLDHARFVQPQRIVA